MKFLENDRKNTDPVLICEEIVPVGLQHLKNGIVSQNKLPYEIVLTEDMGREIADLIGNTAHKVYPCMGASSEHYEEIGPWYGYPHSGGLLDKDEMKWWAYQKCTMSNYEMAWWKILRSSTRIVEAIY